MTTKKVARPEGSSSLTTPAHWGLILALYLTGIGMGALDTGIVNPARTVIQTGLGVDDKTGVWIFTIYTLAYAAAIPVVGKLADILGRKPVYVIAIALFGLGSLGCGLAQDFSSFGLLIASRVVQAIGGGGIMPVATAAIGTIVPPAKRGMALGLVGMVYGVANVFGASAGSLVLSIAGQANWQWIFYLNVPVAVIVIALGLRFLPEQESEPAGTIDVTGTVIFVVLITSLLWAFQNLDFTHIGQSLATPSVWGGFTVAALLVPCFWLIEKRADDPLIDFRYFATINVGTTLLMGAVAGVLMMTVMFIPQFAENSMRLPAGAGGYPTIIIGLASAVGAPISGKLTDRFGPRLVLGIGTVISTIAGFTLIYWASPYPSALSTSVAIFLFGLGLGFLMGAPLTYLILHLIPESEANAGQATLSLVRSLGVTLAPAILVGLLSTAMGDLPRKVMAEMPEAPAAAQASGADATLPPELAQSLQTADVTTIVDRSKDVANALFDEQESRLPQGAGAALPAMEDARADYLAQIEANRGDIEQAFQLGLNEGFARLFWFYTLLSLAGTALLAGLPSKRKIDEKIAASAENGVSAERKVTTEGETSAENKVSAE